MRDTTAPHHPLLVVIDDHPDQLHTLLAPSVRTTTWGLAPDHLGTELDAEAVLERGTHPPGGGRPGLPVARGAGLAAAGAPFGAGGAVGRPDVLRLSVDGPRAAVAVVLHGLASALDGWPGDVVVVPQAADAVPIDPALLVLVASHGLTPGVDLRRATWPGGGGAASGRHASPPAPEPWLPRLAAAARYVEAANAALARARRFGVTRPAGRPARRRRSWREPPGPRRSPRSSAPPAPRRRW